jgi:hypothetical protein
MPARALSYLYPPAAVMAHDWLTMAELAAHGRFATAEAARKYVTRHPDLPRARRGRVLLVDKRVFDTYIAQAGR